MGEQNIWTFVIDYEGGTYVSQFECANIVDAMALYNESDPSDQGAIPLEHDPLPLNGLIEAYCSSGLGKDGSLIIANIIKTTRI